MRSDERLMVYLVKRIMQKFAIQTGKPFPRGTQFDGQGVNFALYSEHATKVELCLFSSADATQEAQRLELPQKTRHIWHGYVPGLQPGQVYGYRVHGPYAPNEAHRFNANKVLLDPYAKAIARRIRWDETIFGYTLGHDKQDLHFDDRDSAASAPLAAIIDPAFDWDGDKPLHISWDKTLIYETHVRGLTMSHPQVPAELRGTYLGLCSPPILEHLKKLRVTAVELLPVHHYSLDHYLIKKGLSNYWGYNTVGFFAPEPRYAKDKNPQAAVHEFKTMVKTFHNAGLEVILDVVYNHTAEGNHLGPTLSFKGIDNATYYRQAPRNPRHYKDYSGCGNTLNVNNPFTLQLIIDSLRYWAEEMHVDGFRFDMTPALAREPEAFNREAAFFDVLHQDPMLSRTKLIAEPWDLGRDGYQAGAFPIHWSEWNGKYRDTVRLFWRGDPGKVAEFATRITGSSDLFAASGRSPHASINFLTCHDGYTLQDWVSYQRKHNRANGENNRDGANHNFSWNCGKEGPSKDPQIQELRERQKRNMMATLLLSKGVPMISSGDELSRSQQGNNNAYCQDNEISWQDWNTTSKQQIFLKFTQRLMQLRKSIPLLSNGKFLHKEALWLGPQGQEMGEEDWHNPDLHFLGLKLSASGSETLMLFSAASEPLSFPLPVDEDGPRWQRILDTRYADGGAKMLLEEDHFTLEPRSVALLQRNAT